MRLLWLLVVVESSSHISSGRGSPLSGRKPIIIIQQNRTKNRAKLRWAELSRASASASACETTEGLQKIYCDENLKKMRLFCSWRENCLEQLSRFATHSYICMWWVSGRCMRWAHTKNKKHKNIWNYYNSVSISISGLNSPEIKQKENAACLLQLILRHGSPDLSTHYFYYKAGGIVKKTPTTNTIIK